MHHVLTRSVRDSAALLDMTHGSEPASWYKLAAPERPYTEEVAREPGRLRIAFSVQSPLGMEVDAEAVRAVEQAARLLESLGHHVEVAAPPIDGRQLAFDFLHMWYAHAAANVAETRALSGCDASDFELDTLALAAMGRGLSALDYVQSYVRMSEYMRALAGVFAALRCVRDADGRLVCAARGRSKDAPLADHRNAPWVQARAGPRGVVGGQRRGQGRPRQSAPRTIYPAGEPDRCARDVSPAARVRERAAAGCAVHCGARGRGIVVVSRWPAREGCSVVRHARFA